MSSFVYFAYGSNMYSRHLRSPDRAPSAVTIGIAHLSGHKLTFDKVSKDGSGKCDAEATSDPMQVVHGALYRISKEHQSSLDRAEGRRSGYELSEVRVDTSSGQIAAFTYLATKKSASLLPWDWYKALVVAGAKEHKLPTEYLKSIEAHAAISDPDESRRAKYDALLRDL